MLALGIHFNDLSVTLQFVVSFWWVKLGLSSILDGSPRVHLHLVRVFLLFLLSVQKSTMI